MKELWNERFSKEEFVYGEEPNVFLSEVLSSLEPGKILFIGEGEGRNAVYAAKLGWEVDAVDYSEEGKKKAEKLAAKYGVAINYSISDLKDFTPKENHYDAVANIYIHLPENLRKEVHSKLIKSLKDGGSFILETFDKEQINYESGGPKNVDILYSLQDIAEDMIDLEFMTFEKKEIDLSEGTGHAGKGKVIRFWGKKNR